MIKQKSGSEPARDAERADDHPKVHGGQWSADDTHVDRQRREREETTSPAAPAGDGARHHPSRNPEKSANGEASPPQPAPPAPVKPYKARGSRRH